MAARDAAFEKRDDKRRHFVREEAEACKQLAPIDILMTHEAARPFIVGDEPTPGAEDAAVIDAGKPAINDVLASVEAAPASLRPPSSVQRNHARRCAVGLHRPH